MTPTTDPRLPDLMTAQEVAELFRVSVMTVYRMCDREELEPVRIGKSFRFFRTDIDEFLAANR